MDARQRPGLRQCRRDHRRREHHRDPILGQVAYRDTVFDANYLNWLVGNGFVISVGFGNPETDRAARQRTEGYFPGREVYVVEMLESWYHGGGVHCHSNDQPAL